MSTCPQCDQPGIFGYRAKNTGEMTWYCTTHRLGQYWADARRNQSTSPRPDAIAFPSHDMRGYWPAQPAAKGTLGGQTATSGAPVQSSAPPTAAPTATDVVNQIQRGQSASASLSKAGGTAPDAQLTPEVLANMSDADFEAALRRAYRDFPP